MIQYPAMLIVLFLSIGCTVAEGESTFNITTKRGDDKIEVTIRDDNAVISVQSPLGISQAVIERNDGAWPNTMTLRLKLKGLEGLKISNGKTNIEAAVSTQDSTLRVWADGKEDSPLDLHSPYWMNIRLIGKNGKPTRDIPLNDGYFEMQLPGSLLENNPQSITINWIDFYR